MTVQIGAWHFYPPPVPAPPMTESLRLPCVPYTPQHCRQIGAADHLNLTLWMFHLHTDGHIKRCSASQIRKDHDAFTARQPLISCIQFLGQRLCRILRKKIDRLIILWLSASNFSPLVIPVAKLPCPVAIIPIILIHLPLLINLSSASAYIIIQIFGTCLKAFLPIHFPLWSDSNFAL